MSVAKILVVDDEPAILEMLSRSLKEEGYRVLAVDNGEGALDKVRQEKPEVVLLDMRMPGIDGIETLGRIREFDKEPSVIIEVSRKEKFFSIFLQTPKIFSPESPFYFLQKESHFKVPVVSF